MYIVFGAVTFLNYYYYIAVVLECKKNMSIERGKLMIE